MKPLVRTLILATAMFAGQAFAARVDGNISLVVQSAGNLSSYSWATYTGHYEGHSAGAMGVWSRL